MSRIVRAFILLAGVVLSAILPAAAQSSGKDTLHPAYSWYHSSFDLDFDAPGLNNRLLIDMWQGNYLAPSRLNQAFDKLSAVPSTRRAGTLTSVALSAGRVTPVDSIHSKGFGVFTGHTSILEARYDPDLFGLLFFGNKPYAGQEIILEDQRFRQVSVQHLGVMGYRNVHKDHSTMSWTYSLSFLKGQYNQEIDIRSASLFTHETGDELALDMDYSYVRSDTQRTAYLDMNGYGLGIGGSFMYIDRNGNHIEAAIQNLGMIRWVNNRYQYDKDSSFTYAGWEIPNIFDASAQVFEGATPDSALAILTGSGTGNSLYRPSPARIGVHAGLVLNDRIQLLLGGSHYLFTLRSPLLYLGTEIEVLSQRRLTLMPYISQGGYGGLHAGLNMGLALGDKVWLNVGTGALDTYFFPDSRVGQSFRFKINIIP